MRSMVVAVALSLALAAATACGNPVRGSEAANANISLDRSAYELKPWRSDYSHLTTASGQVLLGDRPVAHVLVQMAGHATAETDDNGAFQFQLDQSILGKTPFRVASADNATLAGKTIKADTKQKLLRAANEAYVYYPIEVTEAKPSAQSPDQVDVRGRAVLEAGTALPAMHIDKYAIYGVVQDEEGKPVENATVMFTREGVEGFGQSEPTNANGEYRLYYTPEEDEELYLFVIAAGVKYSLPSGKVILFPEDTSVETNFRLPREGTVIDDKPPNLVSRAAGGALYRGIVVGLNVGGDVGYTVTIPREDGTFAMTVPKSVWETKPAFYEKEIAVFRTDPIKPGDTVPSAFLPPPSPTDPDRIPLKSA